MVLQTIALPTELPRRDPQFTKKLASESNAWVRHGLSNRVRRSAMVFAHLSTTAPTPLLLWSVSNARNHGSPYTIVSADLHAGGLGLMCIESWRTETIAFRRRAHVKGSAKGSAVDGAMPKRADVLRSPKHNPHSRRRTSHSRL